MCKTLLEGYNVKLPDLKCNRMGLYWWIEIGNNETNPKTHSFLINQ